MKNSQEGGSETLRNLPIPRTRYGLDEGCRTLNRGYFATKRAIILDNFVSSLAHGGPTIRSEHRQNYPVPDTNVGIGA
jgi:hypothetical protein